MTQPVSPVAFGPVDLSFNAPPPAPGVVPGVAPAPVQPSAIDQMLAEAQADVAVQEAQQARLDHVGALSTMGTQFARGALDAVMAPAALGALVLEGTGDLTGADWLKDFGRDFGKAAQGSELINTYMSLPGMMTSTAGLEDEGRSDFERSRKTLKEQEEAWPMLSAVSHLGGSVAVGLGVGAAAGGAGLGTLAGAAGYEGAGFGAQAGYAKNASLRDVATSALIGASVGAAGTYGIGKGVQALQKRAERTAQLREAFGSADDAAKRAGVTVEEAGGREAQSVIGDLEKARKAALKAAEATDNPQLREQLLASAKGEAAELLAKKAGGFQPAAWTEKAPTPLQKVIYRRQILDHVSDDVSKVASKVDELRPTLDVTLDKGRIAKLAKTTLFGTEAADAPAAIGQLQSRVGELMASVPKTAQGDALRFTLRDASSRLMKADFPTAMSDAHELVRTLGKASLSETDELTRSYAQRAAQSLADDMTGEAFGDAGKLYGQLLAGPGQGFKELTDRTAAREGLRTIMGRGQLPDIMRAEANAIAAAQDAAAKLTGKAGAKGTAAELRAAERFMEKAEAAVTLDGGPVGRVFDYFKDKASSKVANIIGSAAGGMVGGWPGAVAGNVVANAVQSRIAPVLGLLKELGSKRLPGVAGLKHVAEHAAREKATVGASTAYLSLGPKEKHEQNNARAESLREFATATERPELEEGARALDQMAPGLGGIASGDAQERLAQLENDLIRPQPNIRGKAYEVLSSEDLRKNNAMWEATMDPLSVYDDLASGALDYDKLNYTWKQYPGLLFASQMALTDIVHQHLSDDQRANVPEHILSQLDLAFRMEGGLSKSLDRGFAQRIDQANAQLMAEQQQKPQPQGQLNLPGAKPTPVMRIAGNV